MYSIININRRIENGGEKEANVLYADGKTKLVNLILRKNKVLPAHKASVPVIIQCIGGVAELMLENGTGIKKIDLLPGTMITLEANVQHSIVAKPSVSLLLFRLCAAEL